MKDFIIHSKQDSTNFVFLLASQVPSGNMEVALVNATHAVNMPQMRESSTEEPNLLKAFKWTCSTLTQRETWSLLSWASHPSTSDRSHAISIFQHFVLSRHSWRYSRTNLSVLPFAKYVEMQETHGKLSPSVISLRLFLGQPIHFRMISCLILDKNTGYYVITEKYNFEFSTDI